MSVLFTVAIVYVCYDLTVKTRNRRELKRLNRKVFELEQLLEMALLYGKEKESKEAGKETDRSSDTGINA